MTNTSVSLLFLELLTLQLNIGVLFYQAETPAHHALIGELSTRLPQICMVDIADNNSAAILNGAKILEAASKLSLVFLFD